jgi:hypothetical protein
VQGHAETIRKPLDVIVVVDSSGSFDSARAQISSVLAPSLVAQLQRESVDYRVVVVGGAITSPPATDPPRYFYVAANIGSGGLLAALPGYLRMALPHLRMDSLKAILDFTDGRSGIGARTGFYSGMTAADLVPYFGDAMNRRYIFHTVAGLAANTPSTMPWGPMSPVVNSGCSGSNALPCQEEQQISIETGGYRFGVCNLSGYGSFFDAVARQSISDVQVPCEFGQPTTMDGRVPDVMYAVMTLTDGMGMTRQYHSVSDMAACGDGFYLVPGTGGMPGRVVLCPTTCTAVQADQHSMVNFSFECPPG